MKRLAENFKGYYKQLILGPIFKLAEAVMELFVPIIMAGIIDVGIKNGDVQYIITRGLLLLLIGALGLCFALICQYFAASCAQGFARSLRRKLFRHIYGLSQKEHGAIGTSSLITRLTVDVNQIQTGINMFIRLAVRAPFLAIGSIVMAFTISPRIGTVFLLSTPLIVAVLYVIMNYSLPYYKKIQTQQDGISRLAAESLSGVRVIRAFSRQDAEEAQFDAAGDALTAATVRVGKISAALNPITYVIVNLAIVAILWMGGGSVNVGGLEQGQVIALVNYMTQTLLALIVLSNIIVIFTKALASASRVAEILGQESTMQSPAESAAPNADAPRIAFENVTFTYNPGTDPALENISFALQAGQTLGVIGGTGCGKSSLVQVLARVYDVTDGAVLVDGVNVQDYAYEALQEKIGLVPQGAMLFSGTVRSNLQLGAPDATDADLWHALHVAQGEEFVRSKPDGLDALVEEGGKNLSGGQKQRLTIARALAKQPQILILDDSASALDYATDAALRKALKTETQDITVVMISQRASTIKNADAILVLDDGRMAGFGTHESLLETSAVYQEICATQGITKEASA